MIPTAKSSRMAALLVPALLFASSASAQDDTQELAKKLSNPIASLISVPFQFNYDGVRYRAEVPRTDPTDSGSAPALHSCFRKIESLALKSRREL